MIEYRIFDFESDNVEELFELFTATYGEATHYRKRWDWEYGNNPAKQSFKVFIACSKGQIVGSTTRLPVTLQRGDRKVQAAFNCNSMVHPDYRRMGIMEKLYTESAAVIPVLLSKGTLPGMYRLLKKMGYSDIQPNTFMMDLISPVRWIFWRIGSFRPSPSFKPVNTKQTDEFEEVECFGEEFDEFFQRVAGQYDLLIHKNAYYMNWRYKNSPLSEYKVVYRRCSDRIASVFVLAGVGSHVKIVDFLWDNKVLSEPFASIDFIKKYASRCGFLKLICWTTDRELRSCLKRKWFWERKESPQFSVYSLQYAVNDLIGGRLGFFEGDGDSEYL